LSQQELSKTGFTTSIDTQITQVRAVGKNEIETLFEALDAEGISRKGRNLLLAIEVEILFPNIPGYSDNFSDSNVSVICLPHWRSSSLTVFGDSIVYLLAALSSREAHLQGS
jgi:hypothetical protein